MLAKVVGSPAVRCNDLDMVSRDKAAGVRGSKVGMSRTGRDGLGFEEEEEVRAFIISLRGRIKRVWKGPSREFVLSAARLKPFRGRQGQDLDGFDFFFIF
jgi:hypothetical protein